MMQAVFGPDVEVSDIEEMIAKQKVAELLGIGNSKLDDLLDADGDGKLDAKLSKKDLEAAFLGKSSSLKDLMSAISLWYSKLINFIPDSGSRNEKTVGKMYKLADNPTSKPFGLSPAVKIIFTPRHLSTDLLANSKIKLAK
jgi:hypothetical protein